VAVPGIGLEETILVDSITGASALVANPTARGRKNLFSWQETDDQDGEHILLSLFNIFTGISEQDAR
jgi:hypothetical protein